MKGRIITATPAGAAALREFADAIPQAVQNIIEDTEKLKQVYKSVSDTLGIHEADFRNLLQMIKNTQTTAADAINTLPGMLRSTANRIDDYVAHRPGAGAVDSYSNPNEPHDNTNANVVETDSDRPSHSGPVRSLVRKRDKREVIREGMAAIERCVDLKRLDLYDKGIFDENVVSEKLQEFRDECTREFYNDLFGKAQDYRERCAFNPSIHLTEESWGGMNVAENYDAFNTASEQRILREMEINGELNVRVSELGHATVDMSVPRISEKPIELDMSFKSDEIDIDEFYSQGYMQEDALNNLTVEKYLENYNNRVQNGRTAAGAEAQKEYRFATIEVTAYDLMEENPALSYQEARKMAVNMYSKSAALHNPDQIAGGDPTQIHAIGGSRENSAFGALWRSGRAEQLHNAILELSKNMTPEQMKLTRLHVKFNMPKQQQ